MSSPSVFRAPPRPTQRWRSVFPANAGIRVASPVGAGGAQGTCGATVVVPHESAGAGAHDTLVALIGSPATGAASMGGSAVGVASGPSSSSGLLMGLGFLSSTAGGSQAVCIGSAGARASLAATIGAQVVGTA